MLKPCLSVLAILAATAAAYGQASFAGNVVEVLDGRTLVVESNRAKVKVQLQFIETPESDQPLYATVCEHMASLVLGKVVEFRPLRITDGLTVGRVRLAGVDLSQQLLRDGAAWHEPSATSGQPRQEALDYEDQQAMAKAEKRGVWSMPDLKTPWQIRAEKHAELERAEAARRASKPSVVGVNQFQTSNRGSANVNTSWTANGRSGYDIWGDVLAGVGKETRGLQTYTDPQGRFDVRYTPSGFVEMDGGKVDRRLECRLLIGNFNLTGGQREPVYALGFRSVAPDFHFSKMKSRLSFTADKRSFVVGHPSHGVRGDTTVGSIEMFFYRLTNAQVKALGRAKSLDIRIDGMLGSVPEETIALFRELATTLD